MLIAIVTMCRGRVLAACLAHKVSLHFYIVVLDIVVLDIVVVVVAAALHTKVCIVCFDIRCLHLSYRWTPLTTL